MSIAPAGRAASHQHVVGVELVEHTAKLRPVGLGSARHFAEHLARSAKNFNRHIGRVNVAPVSNSVCFVQTNRQGGTGGFWLRGVAIVKVKHVSGLMMFDFLSTAIIDDDQNSRRD